MMKRVTAYEALGGTLHSDKAGAAMASILHLIEGANGEKRGKGIGPSEVAFLIKHRDKIVKILSEIDAAEEAPERRCRR